MTRQKDLTCRDALAALAVSADRLATCGPPDQQSAIRQVLDDCEVAGYVLRYPMLGSPPPLGERLQAYHAHGQCTLKEYGVIQHFLNWVHEHDQAYRKWAATQPPESDDDLDVLADWEKLVQEKAELLEILRGVGTATVCFCGREGEGVDHSSNCERARAVLLRNTHPRLLRRTP